MMTRDQRLAKLADIIKLHPDHNVRSNAMLYDLRLRSGLHEGDGVLPDLDKQVEIYHSEITA